METSRAEVQNSRGRNVGQPRPRRGYSAETRRGTAAAATRTFRGARRRYCEYDGRFSLASLRGADLLYARANTNPKGGGRAVQVATRQGAAWGALRALSFLKGAKKPFDALEDAERARDSADVCGRPSVDNSKRRRRFFWR